MQEGEQTQEGPPTGGDPTQTSGTKITRGSPTGEAGDEQRNKKVRTQDTEEEELLEDEEAFSSNEDSNEEEQIDDESDAVIEEGNGRPSMSAVTKVALVGSGRHRWAPGIRQN